MSNDRDMACNLSYALVRWTGGKDAGKMTVVDCDWIRNFQQFEFDSYGRPCPSDCRQNGDAVVVEWRSVKPDKKGLYKLYEGQLLQCSRKFNVQY